MSVQDIVQNHWHVFGRNYFSRYDYEEVDSKAGDEVMRVVTELQHNAVGQHWGEFEIAVADNFSYHDPVDGSVTKNQVCYSFMI